MNRINLFNIGQKSFNLSIIFLMTAPFLSGLFLILSLIISIILKGEFLIKNKWNYPIFISIGILFLSCIRNTIFNTQEINQNLTLWVDVFNWIPFLLIFIFIPLYISSTNQKILFSKLLIISNVPLLISCFLQKHFEIYGPFSIFNGLIVWYQRVPGETTISTTGLFNNPNYAGFALVTMVPFIFFNIGINNKSKLNKLITIFILLITIYTIFITNSRNAYIGLLISFLLSFGIKIIYIIGISILLLLPINIITFNLFNLETLSIVSKQTLIDFYHNIISIRIGDILFTQRVEIWNKAINLIFQKPIFGWGASTFSFLYLKNNGLYGAQHTHNIILQISQNYGIPFAILISGTVLLLTFKSVRILREVKNKKNLINKFWIISLLVAIFHLLFDVVLFDLRLNILFCILITGSKILVLENKNHDNFNFKDRLFNYK